MENKELNIVEEINCEEYAEFLREVFSNWEEPAEWADNDEPQV